jgi:hypothetical protein
MKYTVDTVSSYDIVMDTADVESSKIGAYVQSQIEKMPDSWRLELKPAERSLGGRRHAAGEFHKQITTKGTA